MAEAGNSIVNKDNEKNMKILFNFKLNDLKKVRPFIKL